MINNVQILTESRCNLKCSYCYIEKNTALNGLHDKIVDAFEKDIYVDSLKKLEQDGAKITNLELWGGEPTLGFPLLKTHLDKFIEVLPHLKNIFVSTNFTTDIDVFIDFILALDAKVNDKTKFSVQISIDGPERINDCGRGTGVTKKIISNLHLFFEKFSKIKLNNVTVELMFKSTLGMDTLFNDFTDYNDVIEYYSFFNSLYDDIIKRNNSRSVNIITGTNPTLAYPGKYSSEDGKRFVSIMTMWQKASKKHNLRHYKDLSLITRGSFKVTDEDILGDASGYVGFCGVGRNTCALTYDGKKTLCHRCLFDYYEHESKYNDSRNGFLESLTIINKDNFMQKNFVKIASSKIADSDYKSNMKDVYESSSKFIVSNIVAMLYNMALCNQVNPLYLTDHKALIKAAHCIAMVDMCLYDNIITGGSYFTKPLSIIRLIGNGAAELLMAEAEKGFSKDER